MSKYSYNGFMKVCQYTLSFFYHLLTHNAMELIWHDNKQIVLLKLCITLAHINSQCPITPSSLFFKSISSLSVFNICNSLRGSLHVGPLFSSLVVSCGLGTGRPSVALGQIINVREWNLHQRTFTVKREPKTVPREWVGGVGQSRC